MIETLAETHARDHGVEAPMVSHAVCFHDAKDTFVRYMVEDRATGVVRTLTFEVTSELIDASGLLAGVEVAV